MLIAKITLLILVSVRGAAVSESLWREPQVKYFSHFPDAIL
jgi:hypothetical protein